MFLDFCIALFLLYLALLGDTCGGWCWHDDKTTEGARKGVLVASWKGGPGLVARISLALVELMCCPQLVLRGAIS